jgi:alkylhydroperoxidase family enzyme
MPRLPPIDPEVLPSEKRAALGFSTSPMTLIFAHASDTFIPLFEAVGALRASPDMDPVLRQLVILHAANSIGSDYLLAQHEPRSLEVGVTEAQIEGVLNGRLGGREGTVVRFIDGLFSDRHPDDEELAGVLAVVSVRALVESILQFGLYVTLGRGIEAAGLPPDEPRPDAQWGLLRPGST